MDHRRQVLEAETRRLEDDMVSRTARMCRDLNDTEETGQKILANLEEQNEQIEGIVANLDKMRTDFVYADSLLKKIASPFAFLNMKKHAEVFETTFGAPAHWSGPLGKKRVLFPGFKTRYFCILFSKLMYFDGDQNIDPSRLQNAKDEFSLSGASIENDRKKLEIILKNGKTKWHLKCSHDQDFIGWVTMLERHINGKFMSNKSKSKSQELIQTNLMNQQPQETVVQSRQQIQKTKQEQIDDNLDDIMAHLDNLNAMALETKQAVDLQNEKLDVVETSVEQTQNDLHFLRSKHGKRLIIS